MVNVSRLKYRTRRNLGKMLVWTSSTSARRRRNSVLTRARASKTSAVDAGNFHDAGKAECIIVRAGSDDAALRIRNADPIGIPVSGQHDGFVGPLGAGDLAEHILAFDRFDRQAEVCIEAQVIQGEGLEVALAGGNFQFVLMQNHRAGLHEARESAVSAVAAVASRSAARQTARSLFAISQRTTGGLT